MYEGSFLQLGQWLFASLVVVAIAFGIALLIGRSRERLKLDQLKLELLQQPSQSASKTVDFDRLAGLPPPVQRYFRHVLTDGQPIVQQVTLQQVGVLRTSLTEASWSSFTARQTVIPPAVSFVWNAKVKLPLTARIRVLDSFIAGVGAGRVSLLSAFPLSSESGSPELNSGALHRYLAEAVWYPTALLPQAGVKWSPIDDELAIATLTESRITVLLVFRFNNAAEVISIYTPTRFRCFEGDYQQMPWEGHFDNYHRKDGMYVPLYGEVGWYSDETLKLSWKGHVADVQYQFEP